MRNILFISLIFTGLLSCNPVKQLEKAQKLADKINAMKIVVNKDSTIFLKGPETIKETLRIDTIQGADNSTTFHYYHNTHTRTTDSVKTFSRDYLKENSLAAELATKTALNAALENTNDKFLNYLKWAAGVLCVLLLFTGFLLALKFKSIWKV